MLHKLILIITLLMFLHATPVRKSQLLNVYRPIHKKAFLEGCYL